MSFRPSCTERGPPEPTAGLAAATSGVAQPQPKPPTEGSLKPKPFWPPYGLAELGWVRMLKNSARNWARRRSPKCQFFASEKSKFLNPESGKMLRPMVPKVPSAGGIMTELPLAKQSNRLSAGVAAPGDPPSNAKAFEVQAEGKPVVLTVEGGIA